MSFIFFFSSVTWRRLLLVPGHIWIWCQAFWLRRTDFYECNKVKIFKSKKLFTLFNSGFKEKANSAVPVLIIPCRESEDCFISILITCSIFNLERTFAGDSSWFSHLFNHTDSLKNMAVWALPTSSSQIHHLVLTVNFVFMKPSCPLSNVKKT